MLLNFARRVLNFARYRLIPPHNMFTHKAEQFYFEEYNRYISPYLVKGQTMLDIGCQMGRFTIPAALKGLNVVATDIRTSYFRFISKKINGKGNVEFRLETLEQSLKSLPKGHFDVVMCLELLYNLPDPAQNLQKLAMLLKPGGVLITSHRSPGYYLFRFIREKNYEAANLILQANHPDYNAQTVDELKTLCLQSDLELLQLVPIGLFSGFGSDAFSGIANPAKMSEQNKLALSRFETNHDLSQMFGNSARYNLMIGRQK